MSVSEAAGGLGKRAGGLDARAKGARIGAVIARVTDRTVVLMLGIAVGGAIIHAFDVSNREGAGAPGSRTTSAVPAPPQAAAPTAPRLPAAAPALAAKPVDPAASGAPEAAVAAASASACTPEPTPQFLRTLAAGSPIRIGVFGDSFGDGVWAALYRRFPKGGGYQVLRFSQPSTGFTRYQQVNLEQKAKAQLASGAIDVAVVNFGANDDEGLFADDGHVAALLGSGWKQVYGDRAERFVAVLRAQGAAVFWMGLPRMRDPAYDQDMQGLSATVGERMSKLGVPYVPVRTLSVDANGDYDDYLNGADGQSRLMRATDGVHMTTAGYGRLAEPVARQIERYIARGHAVLALAPDAARPAGGCAVPAAVQTEAASPAQNPEQPAPQPASVAATPASAPAPVGQP